MLTCRPQWMQPGCRAATKYNSCTYWQSGYTSHFSDTPARTGRSETVLLADASADITKCSHVLAERAPNTPTAFRTRAEQHVLPFT